MKILLRHSSIEYSNYDCAVLHEIFSVISFRVKGAIDEKGWHIPLVF